MERIRNILKSMHLCGDADTAEIVPFKSIEDGTDYEVWKITLAGKRYVLKKAKNFELQIYSSFFADDIVGAPRFYGSVCVDSEAYFLMEYTSGKDLCRCDRESLQKVLDALISLQDKYWEATDQSDVGLSFAESLKHRQERGAYLNDAVLETAYNDFLSAYQTIPRTLCHDDLLPFNVLVSDDGAVIIDWEIAGILPYPTSLARLIAHCEENDTAFFYMKDADKAFAIDYYYDHLIKSKGIRYEDYRNALDLFLFYEYCEWIMLGVKYEDADMNRYRQYLEKAKIHLSKIQNKSLF